MFVGLILLIIGVIFLLRNLGYITEPVWSVIWPAILIVIGVGILLKRLKQRDEGFFWEERFGWGRKKIKEKEE